MKRLLILILCATSATAMNFKVGVPRPTQLPPAPARTHAVNALTLRHTPSSRDPLTMAVHTANPSRVRALLNAGHRADAPCKRFEIPIIHQAAVLAALPNAKPAQIEVLQALLHRVPNIAAANACDWLGETALHKLAYGHAMLYSSESFAPDKVSFDKHNRKQVVQLLLKHGATIDAPTTQDSTKTPRRLDAYLSSSRYSLQSIAQDHRKKAVRFKSNIHVTYYSRKSQELIGVVMFIKNTGPGAQKTCRRWI